MFTISCKVVGRQRILVRDRHAPDVPEQLPVFLPQVFQCHVTVLAGNMGIHTFLMVPSVLLQVPSALGHSIS